MIIDFINSLLGRTRKDDLLKDIQITRESINYFFHICTSPNISYGAHFTMGNNVEGAKIMLNARVSKFSKLNSRQGKQVSTDFYRYFKPKSFSKKSVLFFDICLTLQCILGILAILETKIKDISSPDILVADMTVKRATLIRTVSHFSMIIDYSWDLLDYLLWYENSFLDMDKTQLVSLDNKITTSIFGYAKLLSAYSIKPGTFYELFDSLPDVILNDKTSQGILSVYGNDRLDILNSDPVSGFYSNPIYHVRLVIAERQAKRHAIMVEKKKMLELKLMSLDVQKDKGDDPALTREINYIESRVRKLEHELHELEN